MNKRLSFPVYPFERQEWPDQPLEMEEAEGAVMKTTLRASLWVVVVASTLAFAPQAEAGWYVTYSAPVFYQELAPHGSWFIVEPYGWVWQPSIGVMSTGWRPYYNNGCWFWTDMGWYWHSSYEWGWVPFHYGWWVLSDRQGWVWVPGPYWAPAWVCWRSYPGQYGWAPLPPPSSPGMYAGLGFDCGSLYFGISVSLTSAHYVFCAEDEICEPKVEDHAAPAAETGDIYAKSSPCRDLSGVRDRVTTVIASRPTIAATPAAQAVALRSGPARGNASEQAIRERGAGIFGRAPVMPAQTPSFGGGEPDPTARQTVENRVSQIAARVASRACEVPRNPGVSAGSQWRGAAASAVNSRRAQAAVSKAASDASVSERLDSVRDRIMAGR